ncbi:MAG: glycogen-binding domain-containing protein [Verrucomicrobiota bacterium]|jgi:1,4-alpha-glucan branching enzyme
MKSGLIEFVHPTAKTISIVGTFNRWRADASPMNHVGKCWFKELLLPPGVYEYQLLVDGKSIPHPQSMTTAPNPFGGVNSFLNVTG